MTNENAMLIDIKNSKTLSCPVIDKEYDKVQYLQRLRDEIIEQAADEIIHDNLEVFMELAK